MRWSECRRLLAHDTKHLKSAAIMRERDHLIWERPAIYRLLLHSLVDRTQTLHLKLIGCRFKPVFDAKIWSDPGNARVHFKPIPEARRF
jgi:hypothetical protein